MKEIFTLEHCIKIIAGLVAAWVFIMMVLVIAKLFNRMLEKKLIKKRMAERQAKLWQEKFNDQEQINIMSPEVQRFLEKEIREKIVPKGMEVLFRHF